MAKHRGFDFEDGKSYHICCSCVGELGDFFHHEDDRTRFWNNMHRFHEKYRVVIAAYCMMGNHFHLIILQQNGGNTGEFMRVFNIAFAKYYNFRYERSGPVFSGRFYARPVVDETDFLNLSFYIHNNPVKAEFCKKAADWGYSSYNDFNTKEYCALLSKLMAMPGLKHIHTESCTYEDLLTRHIEQKNPPVPENSHSPCETEHRILESILD